MAASVGAYALSLLSGFTGLILPVILLVIDVYPLRRLDGPAEHAFYDRSLANCGYSEARVSACNRSRRNLARRRTPERLRRGNPSLWRCHTNRTHSRRAGFYLWKTAVPVGLSPLYELRDWSLTLGGLAVVATSVTDCLMRRQWPALWASWICYLALLLTALVTDNVSPQLLADRHSYLPTLPWALLIAVAAVLPFASFDD